LQQGVLTRPRPVADIVGARYLTLPSEEISMAADLVDFWFTMGST